MVATKDSVDAMAALVDVDESDDLGESIDTEVKRQRAGLIVKFGKGDSFTFRTLDFEHTAWVKEHHFWPDKGDTRDAIHTVCPATLKGQRCEYCERGLDWQEQQGIKTQLTYLPQVLWRDFGRVSILAFTANQASPIGAMRTKSDNMKRKYANKPNKITLDMCDIVITQQGEGMKRTFDVDVQPPEELEAEDREIVEKAGGVWSKAETIVRYIRAKSPELLGEPAKGKGGKSFDERDEDEDEGEEDFRLTLPGGK